MIYPIKDYGIIGNLHTAALVSKGGSVDWLCLPRFDSPSIFAGLLDDEKGGRFSIAPVSEGFATKQLYWPDTNVLITRFLSPGAAAEVIDFMPVLAAASPAVEVRRPLIRIARATRGDIRLRMQCLPAFNYARDAHEIKVSGNGAIFHSPTLTLSLIANAPLQAEGPAAAAEFDLNEGKIAAFVLWGSPPEQASGPSSLAAGEAVAEMEKAIDYWRRWLSKCTYAGRWREWVHRSALALELMVYEPTGAIVAAPTTSLPEWIGGTRNWDYRCSWIRDSAFTVYGLLRVGLADEAERFMGWIESRCRDAGADGNLQTLYGIDGRRMLAEETLGHLAGYRGSRPVRVGNAASGQLQLDIYGELMDSVYLFNKYVHPISCELWKDLRRMVNWVAANYHRPDNGIWEVR
ncbi:MAG: glycoside hydrolase family 15 protein, partial [Acidobacteriota bacterium]|nr:glycoside hydrolase family 15 protein [Acidobacteriota bacterium]